VSGTAGVIAWIVGDPTGDRALAAGRHRVTMLGLGVAVAFGW